MARPVLIDTDPGIDDAMALLLALASPELEVLGLTSVFGNTHLDQSTRNALRVLEVGGRPDLPVAPGADRALLRPYRTPNPGIHGQDGLGDAFLDSPPPNAQPSNLSAVELIVRTAFDRPGEVSLIALGPLTNLALALRLEPDLAPKVREVIVMGGAAFQRGNATPVAEANLRSDPEAAAIVFAAPWPVIMVGLDVTNQVVMNDDYLAEVAAVGNSRTDFVGRILPVYRQFYRDRYQQESQLPPFVADGVPTHDPSAVAYAIDPTLFRTTRLPVWVQTEGRSAGQTVPDPYRWWGDAPEVLVCLEVQVESLLDLYLQRLQN